MSQPALENPLGKLAKAFRTNNNQSGTPRSANSSASKLSSFWKKPTRQTPGTIKQVRGASYPPPVDIDSVRTVSDDTLSFDASSGSVNPSSIHTNPEEVVSPDPYNEAKETSARVISKSVPNSPVSSPPTESDPYHKKRRRIRQILDADDFDMEKLRGVCWRGIPPDMRHEVWKILLGYIPKNPSRRETSLRRKRKEYQEMVDRYYEGLEDHRTGSEQAVMRQILLDVPRTSPSLRIFQIPCMSELLTRSLWLWSHRHNASGYVQGINDLITPFVYMFLDHALQEDLNISLDDEGSRESINQLSSERLLEIEADSYFCITALLEGLQRNFTDKQMGIQEMLEQLSGVVKRVNEPLYRHFEEQQLSFIQFSFRWMNCLLMRELSLEHIIRLWDTYLCEGVELSDGFSEFHVFVCAAILLTFADRLLEMDFQDMVLFLQALPTADWNERELETVLAEAYVYQQLFGQKQSRQTIESYHKPKVR